MKKYIFFMLVIALATIIFCGCKQSLDDTSYSNDSNNYNNTSSYTGKSDTKTSSDYKNDVNDWMKDQAKGKDYSKSDGGTYYCMGKGDTCPNHTNNAYDLYCDSCDPDGDNIEG